MQLIFFFTERLNQLQNTNIMIMCDKEFADLNSSLPMEDMKKAAGIFTQLQGFLNEMRLKQLLAFIDNDK
jgi:hypothetical protein